MHQAVEEGRRADRDRAALALDQVDGAGDIPDLLEHDGRAEHEGQLQPVQDAGDVGDRRRHEHPVRRRHLVEVDDALALVEERVVRVEHPFRIRLRAGRVEEQHHVSRVALGCRHWARRYKRRLERARSRQGLADDEHVFQVRERAA